MHCNYLPQDFATRMDGGVAFYDNKPVLISADTQGNIIINSFPDGAKIKRIPAEDPLLDLASPRLGYVNLKEYSVYVYRKPERKYKQTLTYGSIGYYEPTSSGFRIGVDTLFYSSPFREMLLNSYPTLKTAMENLNSKKKVSVAINRNICLAVDSFGIIRVHYKMEEVGYIKPGEFTVRIPKSELAWVVSKYLEKFDWKVE